jgi:ABC-type sugar transport system permease subunit
MRRRALRKKAWVGVLFVLPAAVFVFTFMLFPLLYSGYMSLTEYNFVYDDAPKFVGLDNYARALEDPLVITSLINTFVFGIFYFVAVMVLSLSIAILLFQKIRFNAFFRSSIFVPIVVPLSLAALVFVWILQPNFGLLNYFIRDVLRMPNLTQEWLSNGSTAMAALIIVALWATVGFLTILFLGGLQSISTDILEAAEVDGAAGLKKVFHIILPNLRETYILTGTWAIIHALKVFVEPMVMTEGGPGTSTLVLYQHLYQTAFTYFDMGYGSAIAYILGAIILGLVGLNFLIGRNKNE